MADVLTRSLVATAGYDHTIRYVVYEFLCKLLRSIWLLKGPYQVLGGALWHLLSNNSTPRFTSKPTLHISR
jgi:hypothetical protein